MARKTFIIFMGDDTDSFGNSFITADYPERQGGVTVTKFDFSVANIVKEYPNPVFPLEISLSSDDTANVENAGLYPVFFTYYDENGKAMTVKQDCNVMFKNR